MGELLAENIVFNSPILVRPIPEREVIAAIGVATSADCTAYFHITHPPTSTGLATNGSHNALRFFLIRPMNGHGIS
jgi:hypothetical protein